MPIKHNKIDGSSPNNISSNKFQVIMTKVFGKHTDNFRVIRF